VAGLGVTLVCTVAGLVAGWFVLVRIIEALPEPSPLGAWQRIAVTIVNGALWGFVGARLEDAPKLVSSSSVLSDGQTVVTITGDALPHGWGFVLPTLLLVAILLTVSVIDMRVYRIPDKVVFPGLALALPAIALGGVQALGRTDGLDHARNAIIGMVLYFVILFIPHFVYPKGMGFGDVKLGLVMGLYLGWYSVSGFDILYLVLLAIMLGCIIGVVMGLVVNLVRRKGGVFPFGPALAMGALFIVLTFDKYLTGLR
jgi:leader peptidase (prepilin peptidase)/N-methyltransferase